MNRIIKESRQKPAKSLFNFWRAFSASENFYLLEFTNEFNLKTIMQIKNGTYVIVIMLS